MSLLKKTDRLLVPAVEDTSKILASELSEILAKDHVLEVSIST